MGAPPGYKLAAPADPAGASAAGCVKQEGGGSAGSLAAWQGHAALPHGSVPTSCTVAGDANACRVLIAARGEGEPPLVTYRSMAGEHSSHISVACPNSHFVVSG